MKIPFNRPNNNRDIYLQYRTCIQCPHIGTCSTSAKLFSTGKSLMIALPYAEENTMIC